LTRRASEVGNVRSLQHAVACALGPRYLCREHVPLSDWTVVSMLYVIQNSSILMRTCIEYLKPFSMCDKFEARTVFVEHFIKAELF